MHGVVQAIPKGISGVTGNRDESSGWESGGDRGRSEKSVGKPITTYTDKGRRQEFGSALGMIHCAAGIIWCC